MSYIIITLLFLLPFEALGYPIFGTKRYGRTTPMHSYPMQIPSYYYPMRTHYPVGYYDPYAQEYTDEYYYPQDTYPLYYPAVHAAKYDYYQPALPYYYRNGYYESADPVDDIQEQIHQEEEREQREEALPVGQEQWYENDSSEGDDALDDVNAAFLQNLMLYNDAMSNKKYDYSYQLDPYYNDELLGWEGEKKDDEEVKELKKLAEKPKKQKGKNKKKLSEAEQRLRIFDKGEKKNRKNAGLDNNNSEAWINYSGKRNAMKNTIDPIANLAYKKQELSMHGPLLFKDNAMAFSARKNGKNQVGSTQAPLGTTAASKDLRGGQKEVVLMRPATPVRRPFSEPVMEMLSKQNDIPERKRNPSVYDTIKHLLEMEKSLEKVGCYSLFDSPHSMSSIHERGVVSSPGRLPKYKFAASVLARGGHS